tara:strand:- start:25 stop:348 length:324 start_codon:yes stop_codon:yes gene_type:complete
MESFYQLKENSILRYIPGTEIVDGEITVDESVPHLRTQLLYIIENYCSRNNMCVFTEKSIEYAIECDRNIYTDVGIFGETLEQRLTYFDFLSKELDNFLKEYCITIN